MADAERGAGAGSWAAAPQRAAGGHGEALIRSLAGLCLLALAAGLIYRLWPIVAGGDPLARFFVTEDGYLMLTVARNLAIGNGLSVSGGEIATNGVQPLATFLFALPYLATGGEKLSSLAGILGLSALFATAGAFMVWRFARAALAPLDSSPAWPLLVAALWFCGPLLVFHSMNALETGLYTLVVVTTLLVFGRLVAEGRAFSFGEQLLLGLLCGLVFLARNDGAFLVTAIFLVRFVQSQASGLLSFRRAVLELLPPGILSLAVAAPWLAYNFSRFGSIVPISGQSQSYDKPIGYNLDLAPVKLFETMFPMFPLPGRFEGSALLSALLGLVAAVLLAVFLWRAMRRGGPFRIVLVAYAIYGAMIFGYYALFFGAPHFLSRYFAPLAPLMITAAVWILVDLFGSLAPRVTRPVAALAGIGAVLLSLGLIGRLLMPGVHEQGHFQVVGWVDENVPDETWVGAVQTGTLGYWHDHTINLDGKVNPAALAALYEKGNVLDYVVDSRIDYLADWVGIASWPEMGNARFADAFEIVVEDPARNLAVLRRREAAAEPAN
jgi:hypothetical protein